MGNRLSESDPGESGPSESELALIRLRRAGWSVGDVAFAGPEGTAWLVSGSNGENLIRAWGPTRDEAWREAVGQARAAAMLGRD